MDLRNNSATAYTRTKRILLKLETNADHYYIGNMIIVRPHA